MTCKNNNTLLTAHNQSYGRVPPTYPHLRAVCGLWSSIVYRQYNLSFCIGKLRTLRNTVQIQNRRRTPMLRFSVLPLPRSYSFFAGYGTLTPKTDLGKLTTIMYALAGIPLLFLYMSTIGHIMGQGFKYTYSKLCRWSNVITAYKFLNQLSIMMENWGNFFKIITHSDFCLSLAYYKIVVFVRSHQTFDKLVIDFFSNTCLSYNIGKLKNNSLRNLLVFLLAI